MRANLALAIILLPLVVTAGVYKWVEPDGRIQYSDRPVSGAERLGIHVDQGSRAEEQPLPPERDAADPGPYSSFEIVNPVANQTLRNLDGKVEMSLLIQPPLSEDHRLQILLDGQAVSGEIKGTQMLLKGLAFGSHRLQARIQDDLDATVASTAAVDFHLRKPLPEDLPR